MARMTWVMAGKDEGFAGTTRISCMPATLEELPVATIVAYDNVIQKKVFNALILCFGDRVLWEITKEMTASGI
nr:hypothetical protein [Tanacetum cinerariifolium]